MTNTFIGSMSHAEVDVVTDYIRDLFTIAISHFQNNHSNPSDYDRLKKNQEQQAVRGLDESFHQVSGR